MSLHAQKTWHMPFDSWHWADSQNVQGQLTRSLTHYLIPGSLLREVTERGSSKFHFMLKNMTCAARYLTLSWFPKCPRATDMVVDRLSHFWICLCYLREHGLLQDNFMVKRHGICRSIANSELQGIFFRILTASQNPVGVPCGTERAHYVFCTWHPGWYRLQVSHLSLLD